MIDDKFSLSNFVNELEDNSSAEDLSKLLENEIQTELHTLLKPKMQEIADNLNSMGHNLALYYPAIPGDISYVDKSSGKTLLRVSSDVVISVGFSDADL